jgi:hypothetical protein
MNPFRRAGLVVLIIVAIALPGAAKKKREPPLSTVSFVVLRDENGKPVRNAAVVMHIVADDGKQTANGLELKTSADGKASYEGVPYGKMRIQVLAPGFQTYGEDYEIHDLTLDITIKLKRPGKQYSIYEDHSADKKDDEKQDGEKK